MCTKYQYQTKIHSCGRESGQASSHTCHDRISRDRGTRPRNDRRQRQRHGEASQHTRTDDSKPHTPAGLDVKVTHPNFWRISLVLATSPLLCGSRLESQAKTYRTHPSPALISISKLQQRKPRTQLYSQKHSHRQNHEGVYQMSRGK